MFFKYRLFDFDEIKFTYFLKNLVHVFESPLSNQYQIKDHKLMPVFSFRIFLVLGLTFRSLVHFELIFIYVIREASFFCI